MAALYNSGRNGYSTADATISLQSERGYAMFLLFIFASCSVYSDPLSFSDVASQLGYGYDELDAVTVEDMCMEVSSL